MEGRKGGAVLKPHSSSAMPPPIAPKEFLKRQTSLPPVLSTGESTTNKPKLQRQNNFVDQITTSILRKGSSKRQSRGSSLMSSTPTPPPTPQREASAFQFPSAASSTETLSSRRSSSGLHVINDMEEGEYRFEVEQRSYENPSFRDLCRRIVSWVNDEILESRRVQVRQLEEDLVDGQVLKFLLERLTNKRFDEIPDVVPPSKEHQREILNKVVSRVNEALELPTSATPWTAQSIFERDTSDILKLLIALCRKFRPQVRLPPGVEVRVEQWQKHGDGIVKLGSRTEVLTEKRQFRRQFTTTKKHQLMDFARNHLTSKLNRELTGNFRDDFGDGTNFILLLGLLGGYFVPLHQFSFSPNSVEKIGKNFELVLHLMSDAEIGDDPSLDAQELAHGEEEGILRVLDLIHQKYAETVNSPFPQAGNALFGSTTQGSQSTTQGSHANIPAAATRDSSPFPNITVFGT
ncbi:unnamed protein product [Cyprideis torosa]|uniref:Uncharacterized protein n=1 Tax=Cyprideis torosa TaxID=163714 RepID=A0A7R8W3I7_9CRUS|nr:unnamed protein product [Cyprideis torosa]CAG0882177.1 unnamed protein product [Cyprideis torosa]